MLNGLQVSALQNAVSCPSFFMSMIAIIKTGGKQYTVKEGDVLKVEKLGTADNQTVTFNEVLFLADGASVTVGKPFVKGASVSATVVETKRQEKIRGVKFRHKTRHVRTKNHRQTLTKVKIDKIKA